MLHCKLLSLIKILLIQSIILLISTFYCFAENHKYPSPKSIDFIYVNSSVDESAGGHTALRLEETIFHFQYSSDTGFFILEKENWPKFEYDYSNLQNRTLSIISIPVSEKTYKKIKAQFLTRYLIQKKRFFQMEILNKESDFFDKVSTSDYKIPIDCLGFFSDKDKNNSTALLLRNLIARELGPLYLEGMQKNVKSSIVKIEKQLKPAKLSNTKLNIYSHNTSPASLVNKYLELKELEAALDVLDKALPLSNNELIYTKGTIGKLNGSELKRFQKFKSTLEKSILTILKSSRSDKGSALLLQLARFQAVSQCIKTGYLVTLNPFSENAVEIPANEFLSSYIAAPDKSDKPSNKLTVSSRARAYLKQVELEKLENAALAKYNFFSSDKNENISFNQLETALGRLHEITKVGDDNNKLLKFESGILLPSKTAKVPFTGLYHSDKLKDYSIQAKNNEVKYKQQLLEIYGYNLFARNCVIELFNTVYSCFCSEEQARKELGGYLDPYSTFSFIPFCAFYLVKEKFPKATIKILPSYRNRYKDILYERNGLLALLQESNTLTSEIYYPWEEDSTFLFFTDDVVAIRPLLGIGNTAYAAVNMLGGIVWLPVDNGKLLKRSLRGIIFSLPELGFFNIRKGTFPATAFDLNSDN